MYKNIAGDKMNFWKVTFHFKNFTLKSTYQAKTPGEVLTKAYVDFLITRSDSERAEKDILSITIKKEI